MINRYIYKITCTAGSLKDKFYFGQHTTENLNDNYKGSGTILRNYYKIHPNDYIKEIISFHNTQDELNKAEYEIIKPWLGNEMCLNLRDGGNKGNLTDEVRQKISQTLMGHKLTEETISKLREKNLGVNNPNYGTKWSEVRKQIMSSKMQGRIFNNEWRKKMSDSHKGKTSWNKGKKLFWITKNNIQKQIKEDELQKYLDAGWHKGRK